MLQKTTFDRRFQAWKTANLIGAVGETSFEFVNNFGISSLLHGGLLTLQFLQMFDSFLQDIGFFQFRMTSRLKR